MSGLLQTRLLALAWSVLVLSQRLEANPTEETTDAAAALFDPHRVIQIELRLDPKEWHALRISHRTLDEHYRLVTTEKPYAYYRAEAVIDGRRIEPVGVRKKGSLGSIISSRPGLKIKLDKYVAGQELSGLRMLTLNNDVQDASHVQQCIAYEYMRKAGVRAPRCSLARVMVNGEDLGLYSHVESIDGPFLKSQFGNAAGDLYEGQNGGDFTTEAFDRILYKRGKDKDRLELRRFAELLRAPAPLSLQALDPWLDVDAFLRFWVAEMLVGTRDGYAWASNNYYLYRESASGQLHFIPWGRDNICAPQGDWWGTPVPKSVVALGLLCSRLWQLPEIQARYRQEMTRQLRAVWNEAELRGEVLRLRRLCTQTGQLDEASSAPIYERIFKYIQTRRAEIELELKPPFPEWPNITRGGGAPPPRKERRPMQVDGYFSTVLTASAPTNRLGQGSAGVEITLDAERRSPFTQYAAVAFPARVDYRDVVTVAIDAHDADAGLRWRINFNIDPYRVAPGTQKLVPFAVWAGVIQGEPGKPGTQYRGPYSGLNGTLVLDNAATNLGSAISGKFHIQTTAFDRKD